MFTSGINKMMTENGGKRIKEAVLKSNRILSRNVKKNFSFLSHTPLVLTQLHCIFILLNEHIAHEGT